MNLCWAVYAGLRDTRPMLDGEINEFYARGYEHGRLFVDGRARLEFVRTMELLERLLPASPARVLDIGRRHRRIRPCVAMDHQRSALRHR